MIDVLWGFILSPWGRAIGRLIFWAFGIAVAAVMFGAAWGLLLHGWLFLGGLAVALGLSFVLTAEQAWPSK